MRSPIDKTVILASNSPRRKDLLGTIVPLFQQAPGRDVDEHYPETIYGEEVASYLSKVKAKAYSDLVTDDNLIITADTVVLIDNEILGKPHDADEALEMLKKLSGRTHRVITGVTLMSKERTETFSVTSEVTFDNIPEEELREYIDEYRPFDKAGAYGIQEWIGCRGIRKIDGCFYNIMGLPVNALYSALTTFGK